MAFPDQPLGLRGELWLGSRWENITRDLYTRDPITHTRGRPYRSAVADPASCSATIRNLDGTYTPRNPEGRFYGELGPYTPFRVSFPGGPVTYLEMTGVPDAATTPDAPELDVAADLDVRWEGEADWYALGAQFLIGKWGTAGNRSYHLRVQDGRLYLNTTSGGTAIDGGGWANLPDGVPRRAAVRATIDADNGAGGFVLRLYWATSLAGPWVQFSDDLTASVPLTVFNGTAPLSLAPQQSDGASPGRTVTGRVYRAEVRSGIDGPLVAAPDFTAQPPGTRSFTDAAGRTWTLNGAEVTDRVIRLETEVPEWPPKWSTSEQDAWTPITAAGVLRRLGQGAKALDSTLRRRIPAHKPLAYWPMEEGPSATQAFSPIRGVAPLTLTFADWARADTLPSSKALPVLASNGSDLPTMNGKVPAPAGSLTSWHVQFVYRLDAGPASERTFLRILSTGTVAEWYIQSSSSGSRLLGRDDDGNAIVNTPIATGGDLFGQWVRVRFRVTQNGGNVVWRIDWIDVGGDAGGLEGSVPGKVGRPLRVASPPDGYSPLLDGMALGHISVWADSDTAAYVRAIEAWSGETAGARMRRLCQEEGIPLSLVGDPAETAPMGAQRPAPLLDLLRECAAADGGIFGEAQEWRALEYRTRVNLYNQAPKLVLDYAAGQVAPPFEPVEDDSVRNAWEVQREGGSSGGAVLEEGRYSIQDPPRGIGLIPDSKTLNLASDGQTQPRASWELHLSTWDEARYPSVTILLHKAPELIPYVHALRVGDKLRIEGLPKRFTGSGFVELLVDGWKESLHPRAWTITFNCSPAGPWTVGVVSDVPLSWVDTSGSQLAAPATDTAATVDVATMAGQTWSEDPFDYPWDIRVGGEVMTVAGPGRLLNVNPFLDDGIEGWSPQNGAVSWSHEFVHPQGKGSLFIAPNGAAEQGGASCVATSVGSIMPGASYTLSMWAYSPGGWGNLQPAVDWLGASGNYLSTGFTGNGFTVPAGRWTFLSQTFTAPANASRASLRARHGGTPTTDKTWFAWGIRITALRASSISDTFSRTTFPGWGASDTGPAWVSSGGAVADHYTQGTEAAHQLTSVDVPRLDLIPASGTNFEVQADLATFSTATGGPQFVAVVARATDPDNLYMCQLEFTTTQGVTLSIRKRVRGAETQLGTYATGLTHGAFTFYTVRFQVIGTSLKARVWQRGTADPKAWQLSVTDSSLTTGSLVGLRSVRQTANTNGTLIVGFDNFELPNPQTFRVLRSRNKIVKPQKTGADVRLAYPTIVAL
ncbi:carbohydrate binding domain-containing protein [Streptomyces sp. NPDC057298]|uniref:carbohydrate binding domain-containing protein n=1 Tax=Streptomyces sp. NPDC057298 TaxID=3346091 RepID=UPI0036354C90